MRRVSSPPTAPIDCAVYIVLDDFGEFGTAYRETDPNKSDEKTVIADMLSGQFDNPQRVVAFNTAEGWAHDVSEDIARAIANAALEKNETLTEGTARFVEMHIDNEWPRRRQERQIFMEPNQELRAALAMVRMALAEFTPVPEVGLTAGQEAEILVKAIRRLAAERHQFAQINPA